MNSCKEGLQILMWHHRLFNMLHGFVDAGWAGDIDSRIYTSGYVFNLFGGVVTLMSKRQTVVAL